VQDFLEYETKLFSPQDSSGPYSGPPSEAVDQAWENLYSGEFVLVIALDTYR
jgi:Mycotoxin biosynthesis protein UstYa